MPPSHVYDFHLHTFLSDGALLPIELIRRCIARQYGGLVLADHVGAGTMARVIAETEPDCALARSHWGFEAYAGVELTHVPAAAVAELAGRAGELGAALVIVHGESPVEPVEPGTNLAAARCADVDILAHPGLLSPEAARAARDNDVFIELTSRRGHAMANGHVVQVALDAGAAMLVNSDTHAPDDILTPAWAEHVARCAGVPEDMLQAVLVENAQRALARARDNAARRGLA